MATPFIVKAAIIGGGLFTAWQFTRGVSAVQGQIDDRVSGRTMVQEGSNPDGSTTVRVSNATVTGLHTQALDPSSLKVWTLFQKRTETDVPEHKNIGPTDVPTQHLYIGFGSAGAALTPPVLFVVKTGRIMKNRRVYDAWEFRNRSYTDVEGTKEMEDGYRKHVKTILEERKGQPLHEAHTAVKAWLDERLPATEWAGLPDRVYRWTTYVDQTNVRVFGPPKAIAVESSGGTTPRPVYNADGTRIASSPRRVTP